MFSFFKILWTIIAFTFKATFFVVFGFISSPLHRNCGSPLMCCIDDALCAWIFQLDRRATQISIALMIA